MSEKVALVTGTSSGFGLLASVALAKAGFRVIATMRNLGKKDALLAAAKEAGVAVDVQPLDVTDAESIRRCREYVEKEVGRLDVLVNNAGYGLVGAVEDVPADEFRKQLETNVVGLAETTKAFLPLMRKQRSGRILNLSSMGGRTTFPVFAPYHASKWAVEGLTDSWAYELRPFGIDMVLIEPGAHATEFDRGSIAKVKNPAGPYFAFIEELDAKAERLRGLMGKPEAVTRAIVRAATARRPRFRYRVGVDARSLIPLQAILPTRLYRWMIARMIGVPRTL